MRASEFFTVAGWVLYVAVFALTAARATRRRTRADLEIALFFGTAALIIVTSVGAAAVGPSAATVVVDVSGSLIMILPYLLLRLVANFTDVPRWIMRGAEAGLVCSVVAVFGLEHPLPGGGSCSWWRTSSSLCLTRRLPLGARRGVRQA